MEEVLILHGFAEAQVGDDTDDPGDEARDGGDVDEPVEDHRACLADTEKRQQSHRPGGQDGRIGHASFSRSCKNGGCLAADSQRVQDSGARVQEGVACGPCGCQDRGVDEVVQYGDLGKRDANHPRTCRGIRGPREQTVVGRRANGADHERAEAVKDGKSVHEPTRCLGNVSSGGDGLAGCEGDKFGRGDECEAGLDESRPKGQEAPGASADQVLLDGTVLLPVPEANGFVVGRAAAHDHQTGHDEAQDGDELDTGEPELGLTKDVDGKDVESQVDEEDDGDPDGGGHWGGPVIQNNGACRGFGCNENGVGVPVVPACCEGQTGLDEAFDKVGDGGTF